MANKAKVSSVLELAKYARGDILFWVVLRPIACTPNLEEEDQWMLSEDTHPKVLFDRGVINSWRSRKILPRLHAKDFQLIVDLLTSVPMVEEFEVIDLIRSNNTGEFLYSNPDEEWMPEDALFVRQGDAQKEKARITAMIRNWTSYGSLF